MYYDVSVAIKYLVSCIRWLLFIPRYGLWLQWHMTVKGHNMQCTTVHLVSDISATWCIPGSLTHWKKWYPSFFSCLKITPFFAAKHWLFSSKLPLFRNKTLTFQFKMNPFFVVKHWLFNLNEHPFYGKTLDIKIIPFFFKFSEVSTKIPPFSRKMWIPDFLKKYPFIHENLELGCAW